MSSTALPDGRPRGEPDGAPWRLWWGLLVGTGLGPSVFWGPAGVAAWWWLQ